MDLNAVSEAAVKLEHKVTLTCTYFSLEQWNGWAKSQRPKEKCMEEDSEREESVPKPELNYGGGFEHEH